MFHFTPTPNMKKKLMVSAALLGAFALGSMAHAQMWTFDSNDQGWFIHDFAGEGDYHTNFGTFTADFNATGGNPGGFISHIDPSGGSFFFENTTGLGDYSSFSGGTFNFSLMTDQEANFIDDNVVILRGGASDLTLVSQISPLPNQSWTDYSIDLVASNFTYNNKSGGVVSDADFAAVLGDLTNVLIDAEYHNGVSETTSLDSVWFAAVPTGPSAVPEPSTYSLLGALSLAGLALWRRKK